MRHKIENRTQLYFIFLIGVIVSARMGASPAVSINLKKHSPHPIGQNHHINNLVDFFENLNVPLVLIGEDHRDLIGKKVVTDALSISKLKTGHPCYFVEEDQTYQPEFNLLPKNPKVAAKKHRKRFDDEAILFEKVMGRKPSYWTDFSSLEIISNAKFKILAIDDTKQEFWVQRVGALVQKMFAKQTSELEIFELKSLLVHVRNQSIAKKVDQAFASGLCDFGVLVIGKEHIHRETDHETFPISPLIKVIKTPHKVLNIIECTDSEPCENTDWSDLDLKIKR